MTPFPRFLLASISLLLAQKAQSCSLPDYSRTTISISVSTYEEWTFAAFGIVSGEDCDYNFDYSAAMANGSDLDYFIELVPEERKFKFKSFSASD